MSIWPTEVLQCASSVISVHQNMSPERREALLAGMHEMFLRREKPDDIQRMAHTWARRQEIEIARPDTVRGWWFWGLLAAVVAARALNRRWVLNRISR